MDKKDRAGRPGLFLWGKTNFLDKKTNFAQRQLLLLRHRFLLETDTPGQYRICAPFFTDWVLKFG